MTKRRYRNSILPGKNMILATTVILILIAAVVSFYFYFEREQPQVAIAGPVDLVGLEKDFALTVVDRKSGLRQVEIEIRQEDTEKVIKSETFTRSSNLPRNAGPAKYETTFVLNTGKLGMHDGPAELVVNVRDFSLWNFFRGNLTSKVYSLTVDTKPPKVSRVSSSRYIKPGGSGVVIYAVKGGAATHGVRLNGYFHPGSQLPGKTDQYVAMIGLPYDAEKVDDLHVEARDEAGNVGKSRFGIILKDAPEYHDRINIPDSFLDWKIPEFSSYLDEVSGDKVEKFLYINETVRANNNKRIRELCGNPDKELHWEGRFLRMPGKRMSRFADRRTYYYDGEAIDNQVHLGIDLASYRHADVDAANNGTVEFADYLGIYGNTVIVDHGLGVFSLYAHLSNMTVNPGDFVKKGDKIGSTDTTGMAGGDHLHFSMLINGVFVDPVEWWDPHWIEVSVLSYLNLN